MKRSIRTSSKPTPKRQNRDATAVPHRSARRSRRRAVRGRLKSSARPKRLQLFMTQKGPEFSTQLVPKIEFELTFCEIGAIAPLERSTQTPRCQGPDKCEIVRQ